MANCRPIHSPRQDHESFRFRAAVLDQDGSSTAARGRSDFSSLCTVDEFRATDSAVTVPPPSTSRVAALKRLQRAASAPAVYLRNGSDEKIVDVDFAHEDEVEMPIQRASPCPSLIPIASQRNAGPYTIIAFVNSASGGRMGSTLYESLRSHLGPSHVIDLRSCHPGNMPEDALLKYAHDPMVRILACGGDGTCGWIFSSLDKVWSTVLGQKSSKSRVHLSKYKDHLPLAIMPLGTGNDLSRQFGWGGTFRSHMKDKSMITAVQTSKSSSLDRWRCIIMPVKTLTEEDKQFIPKVLMECYHDAGPVEEEEEDYSRRATVDVLQTLLEDDDSTQISQSRRKSQKELMNMSEPSTQIFDGVFCNYFSLGFDAKVVYLFHKEREMHPEKFTSPLKNKMVYVQKSPYALKAPKLRKNAKVLVNNEKGQLVNLKIPKSCRAIILMNIQSYAGGNRLTAKGDSSDSLIEVIFVSNAIRLASCAMKPTMPFLLFRVAAQTNNVCIRTRCPLHCQVDGEPWLQGEGVIQVKFHSRNSILEKIKDNTSCGCMGDSTEDTVIT